MEEKEYSTFGRHVAVDCWGVDFDKLNDAEYLYSISEVAVELAGAKIESHQSKQFEPHGCTLLVLLSESHLSYHTYPEKGFVALDMYTCGLHVFPQVGIDYIVEQLKPEHFTTKTLIRGTEFGIISTVGE